jgi:hypothetical protein
MGVSKVRNDIRSRRGKDIGFGKGGTPMSAVFLSQDQQFIVKNLVEKDLAYWQSCLATANKAKRYPDVVRLKKDIRRQIARDKRLLSKLAD